MSLSSLAGLIRLEYFGLLSVICQCESSLVCLARKLGRLPVSKIFFLT